MILADYYNMAGDKRYELSNHLGNVLVVVNDKKIPGDANAAIPYYNSDIVSYSDYDPFGMELPYRQHDTPAYRYGFNGKEKDDEVMGEGSYQDYGMRHYNPRLGRFFNVDPIADEYPELTPYQFASNTPICAIDLDGLEMYFMTPPGDLNDESANMLIDFLPVVGDIKGGIEGIIGYDALGHKLTPDERKLGIFGATEFKDANKFIKAVEEVPRLVNEVSKAKALKVAVSDANKIEKKVVNKAEQLRINKAAGAKKEAIVKGQLEKGLNNNEGLLEQASFKINGTKNRAKPDFTIVNKDDGSIVKIVDSKAGNAKKTPRQKELERKGGTLTGKKAREYKGSSTPPTTIEIK